MTRAETITYAIDAGFIPMTSEEMDMFEAFVKLVAEREREACAKVADQISDKYGWGYYGNEVDTADEIADAIRARGQA